MVMELLEKQGLSTGIQRVKEAGTAFGLVIAPPGVDRIFLESPGCSRLFDLEHINFEQIAQSRLFHFGYPPLLKQFYRDGGARLTSLFSTIQSMGVLTSLDFSLPDADSESGKLNWPEILQQVLPFTDIFVPSLEEALQIMLPAEYAAIQSAAGNTELIDLVPLDTIRRIGRGIIDSGVKIALIKAGHRGAYLWTGDVSCLDERAGFNLPASSWNHRELWCEAYPADSSRIKNASGAGDTASAAFLSALLCGEGPELSLQYATLAGRNNLYCNDMYDELSNWPQMTAEIALGPGKITNLKSLADHIIHLA
jgi:sugar/nucleoside kinase (ribokinase family)